jgi:hypothetical protein
MIDEDREAMRQQPLYINKQLLSEELLREIGRGLSTNFPAAQNNVTAESFMYVLSSYTESRPPLNSVYQLDAK